MKFEIGAVLGQNCWYLRVFHVFWRPAKYISAIRRAFVGQAGQESKINSKKQKEGGVESLGDGSIVFKDAARRATSKVSHMVLVQWLHGTQIHGQ